MCFVVVFHFRYLLWGRKKERKKERRNERNRSKLKTVLHILGSVDFHDNRCASHNECVQLWLTGTLTNSACVTHGLPAGNGSDLECHYCCHNTLAGNVCNLDPQQVIPDHLMGAHHGE